MGEVRVTSGEDRTQLDDDTYIFVRYNSYASTRVEWDHSLRTFSNNRRALHPTLI